jgi:plasmid stability protein
MFHMAPDPDSERLAVWLKRDLVDALRVSAAAHGRTQRDVTTEAIREWLLGHPVDGDAVAAKIERAARGE